MSITMRDVARAADVSIKTVSRVVNNQGEVAEDTRQRVLKAIAGLDFHPSKLARALVTQRSDSIGLVLSDITNPFFPEVARGVQDRAEAAGYNVFLCNSDGGYQREVPILRSLADHGVDGLIIFPSFELEQELQAFAAHGRPVVAVNRPFEYPGISRVMIAARRGAGLAVDYLVGKGHIAIAMLASCEPIGRLERVRGYCEALRAHGLPVREEWIIAGPAVREHGRAATRVLLTAHPEITAIFAYNDLLALGAIEACRALGRRVPQECAVVGFDDISLANATAPALTTIHVDKYDLGQQAMARLIGMLDNPGQVFPLICADVTLVVRESA